MITDVIARHYPALYDAMVGNSTPLEEVAEAATLTVEQLVAALEDDTLSIREAVSIRQALFPLYSVDDLFTRVDDHAGREVEFLEGCAACICSRCRYLYDRSPVCEECMVSRILEGVRAFG